MEHHTKLYRMGYEGSKFHQLEIDYCKEDESVAIRCKAWVHFDREALQQLISALEHVRDHHLSQQPKSR